MFRHISHPPKPLSHILQSVVCSFNLFRGYDGPLPSGKPITSSTRLYLWRYSFTFPFYVCVCACACFYVCICGHVHSWNVSRSFTVQVGNACNSISSCVPGSEPVKSDKCQDEKLLRHAGMIIIKPNCSTQSTINCARLLENPVVQWFPSSLGTVCMRQFSKCCVARSH